MPVDVYGWGSSCASCEKLKLEIFKLRVRIVELENTTRLDAEELTALRKLKTEIWDNPDKWMRWCDVRVLKRIEELERELAEKRGKA